MTLGWCRPDSFGLGLEVKLVQQLCGKTVCFQFLQFVQESLEILLIILESCKQSMVVTYTQLPITICRFKHPVVLSQLLEEDHTQY